MPTIDIDAATADQLFQFIWKALAEYGQCDAWGGKEARRVTRLWRESGRPVGIAEFIIAAANKTA